MAERRFNIGDEVCIRGVVCLLDAAGVGTVTIEIHATEQRVTLREDEFDAGNGGEGAEGRRTTPIDRERWRGASTCMGPHLAGPLARLHRLRRRASTDREAKDAAPRRLRYADRSNLRLVRTG